MFGAVIGRGEDYREVFQHFGPGFDLEAERQARLDVGLGEFLNGADVYPGVRPCLAGLRKAGYFVGIAGNQTLRAGRFIRELNLPADLVVTSDEWGVSKPDVAFFHKLVEISGHRPSEVVYVGDRLDNDIAPAAKAGLLTACIRRGPWGYVLQRDDVVPDLRVNTLADLQPQLSALRRLRSCNRVASCLPNGRLRPYIKAPLTVPNRTLNLDTPPAWPGSSLKEGPRSTRASSTSPTPTRVALPSARARRYRRRPRRLIKPSFEPS